MYMGKILKNLMAQIELVIPIEFNPLIYKDQAS